MKTFEMKTNHAALEAAVRAIFGEEGYNRLTVAYKLIDTEMNKAYAVGHEDAAKLDQSKIDQIRQDEYQRGYSLGKRDAEARAADPVDTDEAMRRWVDHVPPYAKTLAAMGGAGAALAKEEIELPDVNIAPEVPGTY